MSSPVLLPDAETEDRPSPQQEHQLQGTSETKAKQKQKPTWRGAPHVTWDPNPSAVRLPPSLYEPLQSRLISPV